MASTDGRIVFEHMNDDEALTVLHRVDSVKEAGFRITRYYDDFKKVAQYLERANDPANRLQILSVQTFGIVTAGVERTGDSHEDVSQRWLLDIGFKQIEHGMIGHVRLVVGPYELSTYPEFKDSEGNRRWFYSKLVNKSYSREAAVSPPPRNRAEVIQLIRRLSA